MNLTTEVNSQVIIFHDGSKVFITDNQAESVIQMSGGQSKGIKINGNYYTFSSISKIVSTQEYYNQYPDQVPDHRSEVFTETTQPYESVEQQLESHKNQFKGVLKGLKQYIDEEITKGNKPLVAIKTYQEKLDKYKQKFKDYNNQTINELAREFNGVVV